MQRGPASCQRREETGCRPVLGLTGTSGLAAGDRKTHGCTPPVHVSIIGHHERMLQCLPVSYILGGRRKDRSRASLGGCLTETTSCSCCEQTFAGFLEIKEIEG